MLVSLLILVIIAAAVWYIITILPLPAPIAQIVQVVFVVFVLIALLDLLLPFSGYHGGLLR